MREKKKKRLNDHRVERNIVVMSTEDEVILLEGTISCLTDNVN